MTDGVEAAGETGGAFLLRGGNPNDWRCVSPKDGTGGLPNCSLPDSAGKPAMSFVKSGGGAWCMGSSSTSLARRVRRFGGGFGGEPEGLPLVPGWRTGRGFGGETSMGVAASCACCHTTPDVLSEEREGL